MATLVIAEFSIKEQYVKQFKELLAFSDGLLDERGCQWLGNSASI